MAKTKRVVITGCSRGIGLEFVRQYLEDGWRVFATCRNPEGALELNRLAASHPERLSVHPLDVVNARHIDALKAVLGVEPLDLLINNAGVLGPREQGFGQTHPEVWGHTLLVNAIAPIKLIEALIDNLAAAGPGVAASLSSKMGSIGDNGSGGYYLYRSSKAALNAALRSAAIDLDGRVHVVALHPGWVRTDMGGPEAQLEPADSVRQMRVLLGRLGPGDSGCFLDLDGSIIPW